MCEILMLIFGIIALVRGRFLLTRAKEIRGWPARIIGVLLVAPFPLSFLVGVAVAAVLSSLVSQGKKVDNENLVLAAQAAGFAIVALCFFAAIGVAMLYAEPIRKNRPEPTDADIPDDYDEHFQGGEREAAESQDIMARPARPPIPPDDRIQG